MSSGHWFWAFGIQRVSGAASMEGEEIGVYLINTITKNKTHHEGHEEHEEHEEKQSVTHYKNILCNNYITH